VWVRKSIETKCYQRIDKIVSLGDVVLLMGKGLTELGRNKFTIHLNVYTVAGGVCGGTIGKWTMKKNLRRDAKTLLGILNRWTEKS